jgi:hypothetical protein
MDVIREHLIYKEVPLTICMAKLTQQERYEVIRLLVATRTKDVTICTHEATNDYITSILKKMDVSFGQCWKEEILIGQFDSPGTDGTELGSSAGGNSS